MAVGTAAVKRKVGTSPGSRHGNAGMSGTGVTYVVALLAQPGLPRLQQLVLGRAMSLVAVEAVLHDRRVFPEEGAAPLRVALVAVLVDGGLDELLGIGRAMRIMATATGHLAFAEGHVRRALQLRAAHLVTLETHLGPRGLHKLPIFSEGLLEAHRFRCGLPLHYLVTGHAGQPAGLMRAATPE